MIFTARPFVTLFARRLWKEGGFCGSEQHHKGTLQARCSFTDKNEWQQIPWLKKGGILVSIEKQSNGAGERFRYFCLLDFMNTRTTTMLNCIIIITI